MKRFGIAFALAIVCSLILVGPAGAATDKGKFDWVIGVPGFPANETMAPNGDTLHMNGTGTMDVAAKTASGGGHLTHTLAGGGSFTTTWTATGLVAFQFYGCGFAGNPNLCGGRAIMTVSIVGPSGPVDGLLTVTCLIGDAPSGAEEGVRLVIPGHINFNKPEEGSTVFIRT